MTELVGICNECKKEVYCLDGFLNGVLTENKEIYCFNCHDKLVIHKEEPQS